MPKKEKSSQNESFKKSLKEELPTHLKGGLRKLMDNEIILSPPVDIYEEKNNYVLIFSVPGMKREDIEVKIIEDKLIVEEKKVEDKKTKKKNAIVEEIEKGRFFRKFKLTSEIDNEKIKANLDDGLLTVNLPKKKEEK
jgi:HSP20 family protein